ncbi:hypothetical protein J2S59_000282 [Nocardioides massiliensis]|uniref:Uncharacterized protein n=1 Tax=Nocardioides massiliensis TaxID=1325935 RepID=A0ABT9NJ87_9ACTN|nr:hypothetical protein [Nocardioides massiliensis]
MNRNVYAEEGTTITWWVPADCPHNEVAISAAATWCETRWGFRAVVSA